MSKQAPTYRKRGPRVLVGFLALLYAVYALGVGKTLALWDKEQQLDRQLVPYQQWQSQVASSLQREQLPMLSPDQVQQELFGKVTQYAEQHRLEVRRLYPTHSIAKNDLQVSTYRVEVEGSFNTMLELIHYLELNFPSARVVSYKMSKEKDLRAKKERLVTSLIIQSISTQNP